MVRFIITCMILFASGCRIMAQCDAFVVYHTKGEVVLVKGSTVIPACKNMKVEPGSQLNIAKESSVILLSGNDKALRLVRPASLYYSQLVSLCQKNQSSLTHEYMKYVAQSIIEKEESQTAMVIKGAVYRTRAEYNNSLMQFPADSSVITSDSVRFAWRHPADTAKRFLLIYENGVKKTFSAEMKDTTLTLPAMEFKPGVIYFWLVSNTSIPADSEPRFTFVHGTGNWQTTVLDEWTKTMKELESEADDAMKKLDSKKNR